MTAIMRSCRLCAVEFKTPVILAFSLTSTPRRHVLEAADAIVPIPEPGQFLAEPLTAPVRMVRQKLADLFDLRRPDPPALNDLCLDHALGVWQKPVQESRPIFDYFLAGSARAGTMTGSAFSLFLAVGDFLRGYAAVAGWEPGVLEMGQFRAQAGLAWG
jgi:hypothetical protein